MDLARRVARFVAETRYEELPSEAVARAQDCLIDTLGCALAGAPLRASQAALDFALSQAAPGSSTLLTTGRSIAASQAAFANAVLASALDLDGGHFEAMGHPAAVVVPVALAAAEEVKSTGRALIEATVVGCEVAIYAGVVQNTHHRQRFYGSGSAGAFGAAAAVSRLRGFDAATTAHALGVARAHMPVSPVLETVDSMPTTKESIGWGALTGMSAALLAERGWTGPPNQLDEPQHTAEWDPQQLPDLGQRYRIIDTYFKRFPACYWAHAAVSAALQLRHQHALQAGEIEAVTVWTHHRAATLGQMAPKSAEAAQYSLPYTVAAALVDGRLGAEQMCEARLEDPEILRLAGRVRLAIDGRLDRMFPARRPARVEVSVADGRRYENEVLVVKGSAEDPFSRQEIDDKFLRLAEPVLGSARSGDVLVLLRGLEGQADLSLLSEALMARQAVPAG